MIGNYSFLNKAYFALLVLGLLVLAVSIASLIALKDFFFFFLSAGLAILLAGILCKILVWYNVYSEVVTKEEFKRVTASGNVFQKRVKKK